MLQPQTPEKPPTPPPIQRMILKGLQQMLAETFRLPPEKIVFFTSTNRMKIAQDVAKLHNGLEGKLEWPVLLLHLNSLALGTEEGKHAYNTRSAARHGQYVKAAESNTRLLKTAIVPVVQEIELFYMTDSFDQAFSYAHSWLTNAIANRMNFTVTYYNMGIDVRVEMSPRINTPDREENVDMPNVFEYQSTMNVVGYATGEHPDDTSYIQLLQKPVINVTIDGIPPDDPKVWSPKHKMPIINETRDDEGKMK